MVLLSAVASLLVCAACGPFGSQEGSDLVDGADQVYRALPTYPGAEQQRHDTSTGTEDESGPVTSGTTLYVFRLPRGASVADVERFYRDRLVARGWRLSDRLPGLPDHQAGPVLNFDRGRDRVSINLEGGYDRQLEVAVTETITSPHGVSGAVDS